MLITLLGGSATVANAPENPTVKQYPNKGIIDNAVNQAKGQEGLNINKTPDQTLSANNQKDAENQSKADYQNQAQKINQAKDQAKQQMDIYHSDHDQWVKEKQKYDQDLAKYNQDKAENEQKNKEIDSNNAEIDRKNAENKANYDKAMGAYNQAKANIDANNKKIDEDNAKAQADYNAAKAKYDQDKAKYDQAKTKYDQDWAAYLAKNNAAKNANLIASSDIIQGLALNKEPNANISFSNVTGTNNADGWMLYDGTNHKSYQMGGEHQRLDINGLTDWSLDYQGGGHSKQWAFVPNTHDAGQHISVTATYTNLSNSSYTDLDGHTQKITKMVITYSMTSNGRNFPTLWVYSDPTDTIWYDGTDDVHVHMEMFNEQGQQITFGDNTYLSFSSLNNDGNKYQEWDNRTPTNGDGTPRAFWESNRTEGVIGSDTVQLKQLAGSSIQLHGNSGYSDDTSQSDRFVAITNPDGTLKQWLYITNEHYDNAQQHFVADLYYATVDASGHFKIGDLYKSNVKDNDFASVNSSIQTWDQDKGPLKYFGSIIGKIKTGTNSVDFDFTTKDDGNIHRFRNPTWAMLSTDIPTTPFNEQKPVPPTPPAEPTINPHDHLDIQPPVMTPDTPHQSNIPFTETPPTPPCEEPQVPNPVDVDYHYDVYNYNSNVQKNFTAKSGQVTNNQVFVNGSTIYAQITGELPNASEMSDPLTVFTVNDDASQYANKAKFGGATILVDGQDHTGDFTVTDRGNGQITISLKNLSLAQGQSFVIMPRWTINRDAELGPLTNKASVVTNGVEQGATPVTVTNFTPSIHKDVDLGEVQGDQGISVDGQIVANGTILTFPLTFKDPLPANRNQDIVHKSIKNH